MKIKLSSLALAALVFAGLPLASSSAQIGVSITVAPPPIPVYEQPACPVEGYLWTPGYWAYDADYYWVPGVWIAPPRARVLWTPGYWGFEGGGYGFHEGYWGPTVGFYGGVNYGFGFIGTGYVGGEWAGDRFRYNTAVTRVNTTVIKNVYVNKTVINNNATKGRASFNGPGGVQRQPTAQEQAASKAEHIPPTSEQASHAETAKSNPDLHASKNGGKPKVAAVAKVGDTGAQPAAAGKPGDKAENAAPGAPGDKGAKAGKGKLADQAPKADAAPAGEKAPKADKVPAADKAPKADNTAPGGKGSKAGKGQKADKAPKADVAPGDAQPAKPGKNADRAGRNHPAKTATPTGDSAAPAPHQGRHAAPGPQAGQHPQPMRAGGRQPGGPHPKGEGNPDKKKAGKPGPEGAPGQ